jgi:hypothetical protein
LPIIGVIPTMRLLAKSLLERIALYNRQKVDDGERVQPLSGTIPLIFEHLIRCKRVRQQDNQLRKHTGAFLRMFHVKYGTN